MIGDDEVGGNEIDLGQMPPGMADMPQGSAAPTSPAVPQYPSVMLQGDGALAKIPDVGRSIFHHKVISRRVHTPTHGPHKGKQRHEIELQFQKMRPMRGYKKAASKSKKSDDEMAMEKLMGG